MIVQRATRTIAVLDLGSPFTLFMNVEVPIDVGLDRFDDDVSGFDGAYDENGDWQDIPKSFWQVKRMEVSYVTARFDADFDLVVYFVGEDEIEKKMFRLGTEWNPRLFLVLLVKEIIEHNFVLSYLESFNRLEFNDLFANYGDMDSNERKEEAYNSQFNNLVGGGIEYL